MQIACVHISGVVLYHTDYTRVVLDTPTNCYRMYYIGSTDTMHINHLCKYNNNLACCGLIQYKQEFISIARLWCYKLQVYISNLNTKVREISTFINILAGMWEDQLTYIECYQTALTHFGLNSVM